MIGCSTHTSLSDTGSDHSFQWASPFAPPVSARNRSSVGGRMPKSEPVRWVCGSQLKSHHIRLGVPLAKMFRREYPSEIWFSQQRESLGRRAGGGGVTWHWKYEVPKFYHCGDSQKLQKVIPSILATRTPSVTHASFWSYGPISMRCNEKRDIETRSSPEENPMVASSV